MAGLLILGLSERAHADLAVSLTATSPAAPAASTGVTAGNNNVAFTLTSGIFSTSGTGFGQDSPFVTAPAKMDLGTATLSSTGAGTVTLVFSQNGITAPVGVGTIFETLTAHVIGTSGSVGVTYSTLGDNSNTLFGQLPSPNIPGTAGQASLTTTVTPGGTTQSATGAFTATSPYSLTEVLVLTFSAAGTVSLSLSSDTSAGFTAVPEPSTMAIAGLGSLGFIAYGLRRRKASGA